MMKLKRINQINKKAESTPITIILLVLIALILIVILWNLIMGLVKKNTETQELQASMMIVNMDIDDVDATNFTEPQYVNITLRRGGGQDILVNRTEIKKYADIVFIIDSTSSMGPQITETYNIITNFVNTLASNKINFTMALVEYKDNYYWGSTYDQQGIISDFPFRVHNFTTADPNIVSNFTTDPNEFKTKLELIRDNIQNGSGGDWAESMLEAINKSILINGFRNLENNANNQYKKLFIVISDSPPHAYDCTCDYKSNIYNKCYSAGGLTGNYEIHYYDNIRKGFRITNNHSSIQMYPSMGNNSVVWTDYRYNSNYEILMCNLSGTSGSTDFSQWCSNSPGLNRVSTLSSSSDYYPRINEDDSIITWYSYINFTTSRIYQCDLNGKGDESIQSWCASLLKGLKILSDPGYNYYASISKNRIVWERALGGGLNKNSYNRNVSEGNSDVYIYDPSLDSEEIRVTSDPNLTLNKTQFTFQGDQFPRFNYTENYPKSPRISNDRIVWQECRNSTDGMYGCNFDIFMCDISGATDEDDITHWCRRNVSDGGRLIKITKNPSNQNNPDINGNIIVWTDYRHTSYGSISLCNISGKNLNEIESWCQNLGYTRVTTESNYNRFPSVSGDVLTWTRGYYFNMSMCNISERGIMSISDWCGNTQFGLKSLYSYVFPIIPNQQNHYLYESSVNGERAVWYEYYYTGTLNTNNHTYKLHGSPYYIKNISDTSKFNNITIYYINKDEGTCKNKTDVLMATNSGGSFYTYTSAPQITSISTDLLDEINEYFRKDIYDHINIVFFNDTKNYLLRIDDIPRPLESKKYSIPKQGSLAGNITNITIIEVYMAAYTRESHREVIGPLLSRWVRRS